MHENIVKLQNIDKDDLKKLGECYVNMEYTFANEKYNKYNYYKPEYNKVILEYLNLNQNELKNKNLQHRIEEVIFPKYVSKFLFTLIELNKCELNIEYNLNNLNISYFVEYLYIRQIISRLCKLKYITDVEKHSGIFILNKKIPLDITASELLIRKKFSILMRKTKINNILN